jgi:transcriptional regulator of met regulon
MVGLEALGVRQLRHAEQVDLLCCAMIRAGTKPAADGPCVPKTSSTSCDQAVFVDRATGVSLPSDAVPVEIDRFG